MPRVGTALSSLVSCVNVYDKEDFTEWPAASRMLAIHNKYSPGILVKRRGVPDRCCGEQISNMSDGCFVRDFRCGAFASVL